MIVLKSTEADFRKELYHRYVSTFKGESFEEDVNALESHWAWCEHKYIPTFNRLRRDDSMLELGCGAGYMMEFLRRHGFSQVQGIDISEEQVGLARKKGLNAQVADALLFLESKSECYDAILALDFIEHFTRDELMRLLPLINQALKADGMLILQTPNGQGLFPRQVIFGDLTHLTVFTPESLSHLLKLFNFNSVAFIETGPVPEKLTGKIRAGLWKLLKLMANTVRRIETGKSQQIWTENMICCCRKSASLVANNIG
ncbi:MAG: hypothetical protein AUG51_24880 [Acidobacteria bacterium 13_1_20CM_3_53_8]|nr:MAG: hypothetical protein AUG51_24880 [Acidobacteria bacterium 13_1_20CM_3_53_8]